MKAITSWWTIGGLLLGITALHLVTHTDAMLSHNVFRRLYYLPIILAAFRGGAAAGAGAAVLASLLYLPHAFLMHVHFDPAPAGDKLLEMVLFVVVGGLTGLLVERERRASRAQQEAEARAARLESLVTLTRGLAHEVRNPLASIQGSFEILEGDYPEGHRKRGIVEVGLRETARLDRVLADFIGFARPAEPRKGPVDLARVAAEVAGSARLLRSDVSLRVDGATAAEVVADADQVAQCLLNLVLNAVQWSPEGGSVRIHVEDGVRPSITVADEGPGIPPADGDRMFDPYFTRREGGTGLGLSVAAQIAHAHGATLEYRDVNGGGACFTLRFSRGTTDHDDHPARRR